jgi:hypothetical protein
VGTLLVIGGIHATISRHFLAGGAALAAATFVATPAFAEKPGCEYKDIDVQRYGGKPFQNPPEIVARDGILSTALVARPADGHGLVEARLPQEDDRSQPAGRGR